MSSRLETGGSARLTAPEKTMEIKDLKSADAAVDDKNADVIQSAVDDERTLRATPSGYGDRMDIDRATDKGTFRDGLTVKGIRDNNKALKGQSASLKGFAKNAAVQALSAMVTKGAENGRTEDQIQQDGISLIQQKSKDTYSLANEQAKAGFQEPQFADGLEQVRAHQRAQENDEVERQATGFGDMVGAAFNQTTAIPALLQSLNRPEYPADPTYDYNARRDEVEYGLSEEDRQFMRESRSLAEEQSRMAEVRGRMDDLKKLSAHGPAWAVAASLTGGLLDPVGWGVGLGVGKAAQVVGLGSIAAFRSGMVAKGAGLGALEGAVGNVAITGLVDAAGGHVTDRDYAYAAGFGMAFGGLGALAGLRSATAEGAQSRMGAAADEFNRAMDETLMDAHVTLRQAREAAGAKVPDADIPESIVPAVQREAAEMQGTTIQQTEVSHEFENSVRAYVNKAELKRNSATLSGKDELVKLGASEDPLMASQAARILSVLGDDVPVIRSTGVKRAHYNPQTHQVFVSPTDEPWVMMHELTHAATSQRMSWGEQNPATAIGALTKEFEALRAVAQKAAKGKDFEAHTKYYLKNKAEFAAGLYSQDPEFLRFLSTVPVRGDGKSLLNAMVTTVRKILGLTANEESVLTRALSINDDLMNSPIQITTRVYRKTKTDPQKFVGEYTNYVGAEQHRAGQAIQDAAAADTVKDLNAAAANLSPEPTPEAVQRELDNIMRQRYNAAMQIVHARVANGKRFLPAADESMVTSEGKVLPPSDFLLPKAERDAVGQAWGIDPLLVSNASDIQILTEMATRAERWTAENPVDAARVNSILGKMPWLASTGLQLAKSKNPVAQMVAGVLLENTTGALGRGRTAALDKNLLQRQYDEYLATAEQHYTAWRNRNNGNIATDLMSGELRDRFMREVSAEIRSRNDGGFGGSSDVDVRAYADQLEKGFDRMRVDQQSRNTIGASRLGDSSRGYSPRRISKKWARGATAEQRRALSKEFADQLEAQWNDRPFAEKIAAGYVERARLEAGGGVTPPTNLYSDEATDVLRDVMRAGAVPDDQIEKLLGKFSRGGQGFTKKRLDLDLDKTVQTEAGDEFNLADAFEHDQAKLYQDYARRVSGEVALANFGIYGQHGLMQLRRLIADFNPAGKQATIDEVRAFDQVAAEFYGTPLPGTGNKAMGNLRLLSSMSMLGGMAFNQFAEFSNSLPLLGLGGALRQVAEMPRLIKDVVQRRGNPLLDSLELVGGPIGHDQRVVFPYQELDDTQVWGAGDLNAFDRVLRGGAQAMPWLSGFHYVHAAQVRGMSEQIVMKALRYINEDTESAALASMGFNPSLRLALKNELPRIAEFDASGRLIALDITKAENVDAAMEFVQAVHRGSKQIIQGTYIGETGAWAHNDLLRLLTQFRTFSITSMEKQWSRQRADLGTIKAVGLLLGSMSFAIPIQMARIQLNAAGREDSQEYIERQMAPGMFARNLLNYSSISGVLGDVIDSGAALTGNSVSGGRTGAQKSAADAIPAIGYINNAVQAIGERDPRELLRSLPGQNLPFVTPLMNFTD